MIAIWKREFFAYFKSLRGFVFLALFFGTMGVAYAIQVLSYGYTDITAAIFSQFFYRLMVFAVTIPILTMSMFSQEKKQHTEKLLFSSPLPAWKIVTGKYLAALAVYGLGIFSIIFFPILIAVKGKLPLKMTVCGFVGMILMGVALIGLCTMISELIREPMIGVIVEVIIGVVIMMSGSLSSFVPDGYLANFIFFGVLSLIIAVLFYLNTKQIAYGIGAFAVCAIATVLAFFANKEWFMYGIGNTIQFISVESYFEEMMNGAISIGAVIYMVSFGVLCVFLASQNLDAKRWR